MHTHDNNFDEAVHLLRKARRLAETDIDTSGEGGNTAEVAVGAARAVLFAGAEQTSAAHTTEFARRAKQSRTESLANIISLLGINLFRQLPARPEVRCLKEDASLLCFVFFLLPCFLSFHDAGVIARAAERTERAIPAHSMPHIAPVLRRSVQPGRGYGHRAGLLPQSARPRPKQPSLVCELSAYLPAAQPSECGVCWRGVFFVILQRFFFCLSLWCVLVCWRAVT